MRKVVKAGDVFGGWTVVQTAPFSVGVGRRKRSEYLCLCTCGSQRRVNASNLLRGLTKSCGCQSVKAIGDRSRTHGMSETPMYAVWRTMKQRCDKENFRQYKDYGGRGIKVCERWYSFENFLEDMGEPPPGTSLERVDNNKGYEPGNVVWAGRLTQARNKRNTVRYEYGGLALTLQEWADRLGIKKDTLASRIYLYKWPLDRALKAELETGRTRHTDKIDPSTTELLDEVFAKEVATV